MSRNYDKRPNGYLETIQQGLDGVRGFQDGLSLGIGTRAEQIGRLKTELKTADAIVIGAGAGLSISAGFVYSGERFRYWFSDFAERFGITDSCFIRCSLRFSDFDVRILFTEHFLEHLTDVTAILTLPLHALDALICGKQR